MAYRHRCKQLRCVKSRVNIQWCAAFQALGCPPGSSRWQGPCRSTHILKGAQALGELLPSAVRSATFLRTSCISKSWTGATRPSGSFGGQRSVRFPWSYRRAGSETSSAALVFPCTCGKRQSAMPDSATPWWPRPWAQCVHLQAWSKTQHSLMLLLQCSSWDLFPHSVSQSAGLPLRHSPTSPAKPRHGSHAPFQRHRDLSHHVLLLLAQTRPWQLGCHMNFLCDILWILSFGSYRIYTARLLPLVVHAVAVRCHDHGVVRPHARFLLL